MCKRVRERIEERHRFFLMLIITIPCFDGYTGAVFPTPLLEISGLNKLDLSYQGIVTVPDDIKAMKNLQILVLTGCQMLESLSPELVNLPLKGV